MLILNASFLEAITRTNYSATRLSYELHFHIVLCGLESLQVELDSTGGEMMAEMNAVFHGHCYQNSLLLLESIFLPAHPAPLSPASCFYFMFESHSVFGLFSVYNLHEEGVGLSSGESGSGN